MQRQNTSATLDWSLIPTLAHLSLFLLGTFEAHSDGIPLPRTRTRKEQWLLAYLLLHPHKALDRSQVAGTLWPESGESQALKNLRRSLSDLRDVLGEDAFRILSPTPRTIAFDLVGMTCDLSEFDAAIARGDSTSLQRAVSLYRGPLLEDCDAIWITPEREARAQSFLMALETLAKHAGERGDNIAAVGYLRRAVTADPFRETTQCALMDALATSGDVTGAILVYRQFRLLLHEQLNTTPSPATIALYQQLHTPGQSSNQQTQVPHQATPRTPNQTPNVSLPHPLSGLIGREQEVLAVLSRVTTKRLVTLTGTGGIGKTRLAIATAEAALLYFSEGVWFVDLAPLSEATLIPQAIAARLTVSEKADEPLLTTLLNFLAGKRLLLILDNCEHLMEGCAPLVESLLLNCPSLHLLATSRQALGLLGEAVWRVPSLTVPSPEAAHASQVANILQADAVRLFVARAMEASPTFTLTPQNAPALVQICRSLDGIPLALELAAARIKVLSAEQIAARLHRAFVLLTGGSRTALSRHQTLRGLLDWSYDLLPPLEKLLFHRLSLFAGSWTLEAAEAICMGEEIEADSVLELLSELVDKSLVGVEAEFESQKRFRLLETVRQYGQERLREAEEEERLSERHADYFLQQAEVWAQCLSDGEVKQALASLEPEHDNLRAAIAWFRKREGTTEKELRLVSALGSFWYLRGYWREGREHLLRVTTRTSDNPVTSSLGYAFNHLGWMALKQGGEIAVAQRCFEKSLAIFRNLKDSLGTAHSLQRLGCLAIDKQEFDAAQEFLEEALLLFRETNNLRNVAFALNNLGILAEWRMDNAGASVYYTQGVSIARKHRGADALTLLLTNLGGLIARSGDFDTARQHLAEGLRLAWEMGDRPRVLSTLMSLTILDYQQEKKQRATHLYGAVLAACEQIGFHFVTGDDEEYQKVLVSLRSDLGEVAFTRARAIGQAMTLEQAVNYALAP